MPPAHTTAEPLRPDPLAGTSYQALKRLGGGATALVYEARHVALDKLVVVKLLHGELAGQAMPLERMRFEARALAKLSHPNLTAVTDFGQTADGRPFFVMERHEGRSLLVELRERGHLPVSEAVALVLQLLAGLEAAHAIGIIHRDIKPENLFLCRDAGRAPALKVLDFGIATLLPGVDPSRAPAPRALQTEEGVMVGTPRFLSPEQVRCLDVDPRTDVYGAGMVLFELLAGRNPFYDVEDFVGLLQAHVSRVPAPPSALAGQPIPPAIDAAVLRALAKRPEDRYPTAADFAAALSRALEQGTMGSPMPAQAAPTDAALKPGEIFRGQFRALDLLGEGLHGEVYLVEHVHTSVQFALKVLRLEHARDASRVQRALRTAKASYRIQHANVVTVVDVGCEDDGRVWVLMELLEGASLAARLARSSGRISVRLAFHIAISAGWGVDAAHELRILHRDLKPDNLWVTNRGWVKVLDWSIAKVIPDGVATTKRTTGLGTTPWVSPEMLRGGEVDARADIYALGLILYEMLAGAHPFADVFRNTAEMLRRQLFVDPPRLSTVTSLPPYVDEFMVRAIHKDPAMRFRSMGEMVKAMIELRDRLEADARQGLITLEVVAGEPPICNDPSGERAYQAPAPPPEPVVPDAPEPSRRVVVPVATSKDTQPLPAGLAIGPKGTLPLGATLPQPGARETAPAVERSPSPFAATTRTSRSRVPARLAALAVAAAVAALVSIPLWLRFRGSTSTQPLALPSASASAAVPAEPTAPASGSVAAEAEPAPSMSASTSVSKAAPPPPAPAPAPATASAAPSVQLPPRKPAPAPQPTVPVAYGAYGIGPSVPAPPPSASASHRVFGIEN